MYYIVRGAFFYVILGLSYGYPMVMLWLSYGSGCPGKVREQYAGG